MIEIDGETHASVGGIEHDARRDAWLSAQGFRVLRFSNREVLSNLEGVLMMIGEALKHPHPGPLPQAGEGEERARKDAR